MADENPSASMLDTWEELREFFKKYPVRHVTMTARMPDPRFDIPVSIMRNTSAGIHPVRELSLHLTKTRPENKNIEVKLDYYKAIIDNKPYTPGQEGNNNGKGN